MRPSPCSGPRLLIIAALLSSLVLAGGCSDDDPVRPPPGPDISGRIELASSGQVAEGAVAYLGIVQPGFSGTYTAIIDSTDADPQGRYEFDDLANGDYRVYAGVWGRSNFGFGLVSGFSRVMAVDCGATAKGAGHRADLELLEVRKAGVVAGKVAIMPPGTAPVDSAEVRLFGFYGADLIMVDEELTDAAGQFAFGAVATGNYVVSAIKYFLPSGAPFPVYMSGESEPFFCDGQDVVQLETLTLSETAVEKPAVYLYPELTGEVAVSLELAAGTRLTASEPPYGQGWRVEVTASGRIDGRYDYLFYEAALRGAPVLSEGWCFASTDLGAGLAQVLEQAGLNAAERADFLDYWLARLPAYDHYLVQPVFGDDLDTWVKLDVEPDPDSRLRLWLFFQGSERPRELAAPPIVPFERRGFTVVEWGGAVLPPRLR